MQSRAHRHGLPKETVLTCVLFRNVVSRVTFAREKKISVTCGLIKQGKPGKRERFMAYARIEQSEGVPAFGET
jgi:hypothetical protein